MIARSTHSILVLALATTAAACSAPSDDATLGTDLAEYRHSNRLRIHFCSTGTRPLDDGSLVASASIVVDSERSGDDPRLTALVKLAMSNEERETLRETEPFRVPGAVRVDSSLDESATVSERHYQTEDGRIELDMTLGEPRRNEHNVIVRGSGHVAVKIDFASSTAVLPNRIRSLGERTIELDLKECR